MVSDGRVRSEIGLSNAAALIEGLLRVSQIVRFRFNDWLSDFELNDGRYSVLTALARAGEAGCSQAELADRLCQSESNISTLIERMQRDGLVNRSRSDADRRKRVLRITSDGLAMLATVDAKRTSWAGRLLNGIPAEDGQKLIFLLERLGSSLDPAFEISKTAPASPRNVVASIPRNAILDDEIPGEDLESPQVALRRMLLELSSSVDAETCEKGAA